MKPHVFALASILILGLCGCREETRIDSHPSKLASSDQSLAGKTSKTPEKKDVFEVSEDALPQCTPIFWEQ